MTNNPLTGNRLTPQQLQDVYDVAVMAERARQNGKDMSDFDLLCKLDEFDGIAHVVRTLIDTVRSERAELQQYRKMADWQIAGWVMSKNRLPPVNTTVLAVYLAGDVWHVGCGCLSSGHPHLRDGWYAHGISGCKVSCWMPLPDIPEDEL